MNLIDMELILLDGKCRPDIQAEVNAAKARIAMQTKLIGVEPHIAAFVANAVGEALKNGRLVHYHKPLQTCFYCKASGSYRKHTRYSRYHRRGEPDYNHPLPLSGVELAERFITVNGYATLGCCTLCFEKALPHLRVALADVKAEIPESLTGTACQWKRWDNMECTTCGWKGHEGEMRQLRSIMGDSWYPGGCPKCSAENRFLGRRLIKKTDGWKLVPRTTGTKGG